MITNISSKIHTANKDYNDSSGEYIKEMVDDARHWKKSFKEWYKGITFSELRAIAKLKANSYKILKGQKYERQFNVDGGDKWENKSLPEIISICYKYDLYPQD